MNYILVTGGLGFIGSHICVELLEVNYNVVIIDNLNNSTYDTYYKILKITNKIENCKIYIQDITSLKKLEQIFKKYKFDAIIHCAGKKSVSESIQIPIEYYKNNILTTLHLLECVEKYKIKRFIFSSSATVYGKGTIFCEDHETGKNITNPYGQTKFMQEQIIKDFAYNHKDKKFIILRYFNPVGAHSSGLIGENPLGIPNNLMPYILRVGVNNLNLNFKDDVYKKLVVFGNDYDTKDGTCIRDFIHVVDLAKAHLKAFEFNNSKNNYLLFNLGTGIGTSVQEMINIFQSVNNLKINVEYGKRRQGDYPIVICDTTKALTELNWLPTKTLENIMRDSWNFMKKLLNITSDFK